MRVFKTRWFVRFARHEGISDNALKAAVARAERGLVDAELGGNLIKQRVARPGKGRSGGYRVSMAYRSADRAFFVFGFAKSRMDNIEAGDLLSVRAVVAALVALNADGITAALATGEIEEIE